MTSRLREKKIPMSRAHTVGIVHGLYSIAFHLPALPSRSRRGLDSVTGLDSTQRHLLPPCRLLLFCHFCRLLQSILTFLDGLMTLLELMHL